MTETPKGTSEPDRFELLIHLAAQLRTRGLSANVIKAEGESAEPFCRVQNQDVGDLAEHVTCSEADGELHYCWSWGTPIAPVRHVESAAERVAYVLSSKAPSP